MKNREWPGQILFRALFESTSFKMIVIGVLILILLIPVAMVESLVREREQRQHKVVAEISTKWGGAQVIQGPVLAIPYQRTYSDGKGQQHHVRGFVKLLPETLTVTGQVQPEQRKRGIYSVVLYQAQMQLSGEFILPSFDGLLEPGGEVQWGRAQLGIGLSDMRGIRAGIEGMFGESPLAFDPGVQCFTALEQGVSSQVNLKAEQKSYGFSLKISVNGSQNLSFAPVGKVTEVSLESPWPDPSFSGAFLPTERTITDQGFAAKWRVQYLSRQYPQAWTDGDIRFDESVFGVCLYTAVDIYQKTMRTVKYALLFIICTFAAFFLSETVFRRRVHPMQYLLVGLGNVIFYTLLLSLSEHIPFAIAYLVSGLAVVTMISCYARAVLARRSAVFTVTALQAALYGYLFFLLHMEDYALLMGSIGLFLLLGAVMYWTRNVRWYGPDRIMESEETVPDDRSVE